MRRIAERIAAVAAAALVPCAALAHAGHHDPADGGGFLHVLTQPDHLVAVVLAGAVVVAAIKSVGIAAARMRCRRIGSSVVRRYRGVR
jgi:hydrogenase/urease accessory protein HupE